MPRSRSTTRRSRGRRARRWSASWTRRRAPACGDLHIPAGEYKIHFTIGEDLGWSINFKGKDKTHTTKLALSDSEHESKRLMMCLYAGEDEGAGVYVAFGKHSGMLELKPHTAEK
jgi:hypothetical protein